MQQSATADRRGPVAAYWLVLSPTLVVGACVWVALHVEELLEFWPAGKHLFSRYLWASWNGPQPQVDLLPILVPVLVAAVCIWMGVSLVLARRRGMPFGRAAADASRAFGWLWFVGLFYVTRMVILGLILPYAKDPPEARGLFTAIFWQEVLLVLRVMIPYVLMLFVGGWLAALAGRLQRRAPDDLEPARGLLAWRGTIWVAMGVYAIVFSTMAILQYEALWVPHGDSGMYEEHIWNVLHGKGFMSQLDNGRSFLGEHIQVFHLLLTPIYVIYPRLTTLNVCQTVALASAALPIVWFARDKLKDSKAATLLGLAYLMYPAMQLLNLELTGKTFRPITFCVPLLAWAFYAFHKSRYKTTLVLLALAISCKEELAAVVACFGVYMMFRRERGPWGKRERWLGLAVTAVAVGYFLLATMVLIPYFRQGEAHFAGYYNDLGKSFGEILQTTLTRPDKVLHILIGVPESTSGIKRGVFVLALFVPLALVPLAAPSRWWLALPTLAYCLLASDENLFGLYHFHAPLVPILMFAAVQGVASCARMREQGMSETTARVVRRLARLVFLKSLAAKTQAGGGTPGTGPPTVRRLAWRIAACSFVAMVLLGKSPLSIKFWDPTVTMAPARPGLADDYVRFKHAHRYWRWSYVPTERAERFRKVYPLIPESASVASSDFIHSRFTHHRLSHDFPVRPYMSTDRLAEIDYFVIDIRDKWVSSGKTATKKGEKGLPLSHFIQVRPEAMERDKTQLGAMMRLRFIDGPRLGLDTWEKWKRYLELRPGFEPVYFDEYFWVFRRKGAGS